MRLLPRPFIPYIGQNPTWLVLQCLRRAYLPNILDAMQTEPISIRMARERRGQTSR